MNPAPDQARRLRALIVDDDPALRIAIQQFIARLGFDTQVAENGKLGADAFAAHGADLVLLDGAMPVMDGFAACAAIRGLPEGHHVPIIMITVFEDDGSVDRAFAAGADEFITKPIHWAVLRHRVHQLVNAAGATRQLHNDRAFFQSLVDAIPDPTLVCDQEGQVRWINASAQRCFIVLNPQVDSPLRLADGVDLLGGGQASPAAILSDIRAQVAASQAPVELVLHRQTPDGDHYSEVHARALRGVAGDNFGMILRLHDVTQRELEGRRLRSEVSHFGQLAYHDSLTGLANRRLFENRIETAVTEAARYGERLAVLYLDLDGFKTINDSLGHEVGDEVLRLVAERLTEQVRRSDTVARWGGDEFAILLPQVTEEVAVAQLGERILFSVGTPMDLGGVQRRITTSIGIAMYPQHAATADDLIRQADEAMYRVKHSGKQGLCFAEGAGPD